MKTKYERLSKKEQKELFLEYKVEKEELAKKMTRSILITKIAVVLSVFMFLYEFFITKSSLGYWTDIVIFVSSLFALFKFNSMKKDLLNDYLLKKEKSKKEKVLKKHKKKD